MIDHKELRRLALSATPGPWKWDDKGFGILQQTNGKSWEYVLDPVNEAGNTGYMQGKDDDKAYIAAASPSVVLALLDEVEAMREKLKHAEMAAESEARLADEFRKDASRFEWIVDHCVTTGGGDGFVIFVPVDHEDIGCGIDAAMQAKEEQ